MNRVELIKLIHCIDLTDLNIGCTDADVITLCKNAITPLGPVAAVCVYPEFVSLAWKNLMETPIKIATVINFPGKNYAPEYIPQAILDGASEIDAVMPDNDEGEFVARCKYYCGDKAILKVILESGGADPASIARRSQIAIENGADFLKTSTGKSPVGATLEAARIMLNVIKKMKNVKNKKIGFKASGGIHTLNDAREYVSVAQEIRGEAAFCPTLFRLGTSRLLQDILCKSPHLN